MATLSAIFGVRPARGSVFRAISLGELVWTSNHAFVGTPIDTFSRWELVGRHSRVVTYTVVRTEYSFDGRPPDPEVTVRSLGGIVDGVGQLVPGEAVLHRGATAALFVSEMAPAIFCVTAMAQGHYPLVVGAGNVRRLTATPMARETLGGAGHSAVERLDRSTLQEAEHLVLGELFRGKP
jgi:hypothetical protein